MELRTVKQGGWTSWYMKCSLRLRLLAVFNSKISIILVSNVSESHVYSLCCSSNCSFSIHVLSLHVADLCRNRVCAVSATSFLFCQLFPPGMAGQVVPQISRWGQ